MTTTVEFRLGRRMWDFRTGQRKVAWGPWRTFEDGCERKLGWHLQVRTTIEPSLSERLVEIRREERR